MKKLVISLVLGASLAIVPSAFALKAMTSDSMKDTTAQAGVSIAVDNVLIYQSVGTTTYTDTDGLGAADGVAASITITGKETITRVNALTDGTIAENPYATMMVTAGIFAATTDFVASALSIDICSALPALTAGVSYNNGGPAPIGGVHIALPTVEVLKTGDTQTYGYAGASANNGADYIQITKTDSVLAILSGTLEIAPH